MRSPLYLRATPSTVTTRRKIARLSAFRVLLLTTFATLAVSNIVKPSSVQLSAASSTDQKQLLEALQSVQSYTQIEPQAAKPHLAARSYILIDSLTNDVLIAKNDRQSVPVASTTKMVTALVVLKNFELNQPITVDRRATTVPGSKIGLKAGEIITVENLLKGLLIQSGNDAAYALAYAYGQRYDQEADEQRFVAEMNRFVRAHHLTQTKFGDPAGLDDDQGRSTPFELTQIARLVLKEEVLKQMVVTSKETITSVEGTIEHQLKNSNRLVHSDSPYYLPSAKGIKTGYTNAAGHCLVGAYQLKNRLLIGVILHTTESTNEASAKEMHKLFTWAENNVAIRDY